MTTQSAQPATTACSSPCSGDSFTRLLAVSRRPHAAGRGYCRSSCYIWPLHSATAAPLSIVVWQQRHPAAWDADDTLGPVLLSLGQPASSQPLLAPLACNRWAAAAAAAAPELAAASCRHNF